MQARLQNELQQVQAALWDNDDQKVDPCILTIYPSNGDLSTWICIFQGRRTTPLEGAAYKMQLAFTQKYPYQPPEVTMLDGFQHLHVFTKGKICYRLLIKENWKINYSILFLVNGLITMLHGEPAVSDPASTSMAALIDRGAVNNQVPNLKKYNEYLRNQAKRFAHRYQKEIEGHKTRQKREEQKEKEKEKEKKEAE